MAGVEGKGLDVDAYPPSDDVSPRPGYGSSVTGDSGVEDESLGSVDRRYAEGHGGAGGDDDGASGQSGTYTVDILQRRIKTLESENASLRLWSARVELHLHRYQALDPKLAATVAQVAEGEDVPPAPWLADPSALAPLIKSYDARIEELEVKAKEQAEQYDEALQNAEAMKNEILNLQKQLGDATNQLVQQASTNPAAAAVAFGGGDALLEQRAELEERLRYTLEECGLLQDQVSTLNEETNKQVATIAERDKRLALVTQRYQQAVTALQRLQAQVQRVAADKQTCETKVIQQTTALTESKRTQGKLADEVKHLKQENAQQKAKIGELKHALTELRRLIDDEKNEVDDQLRTSAEQSRHLQAKLTKMGGELESTKAELRQRSEDFDKLYRDHDGAIAQLQMYEQRLNRYAAEEDRWQALEKESLEKVEQAHLERDEALGKETDFRREIGRLLEARTTDAREALRRQAAAVDAVRARLSEQLNKRNGELHAMTLKCTELQALADRCARDRQTAEREVERLMESASKEHGSLNDQVEAIVDRMKEVESERDSAVLALREARADAAESERRWAAKLEADREDQDTARRVQEDLTNELDDMRLKLRNAQASVKDLTAQVQDMDAKLAKERARLQSRLDAITAEKRDREVESDRALHEMQSALQKSTDKITELEATNAEQAQQHRDALRSVQDKFGRALEELTEDRNRLAARNEDLAAQLTHVSSQREELIVYRQDLDNKLQHMHARVLDAEKRASSGAAQLSQAFSDQERRLQELKAARADADRASLAEARAVRRQKQLENRIQEVQQQNEQLQAFATGSHPLYLENGVSATPQTQRRTERFGRTTTTSLVQSSSGLEPLRQ